MFDELIRAITELIDTLNKQPVSNNSWFADNWATIIVPVASLLGVVLSTIITTRTTKKITKKNIDANITASARIEWIQNVRRSTAELLSVYYSILTENDVAKKQELLQKSREKKELLILFFGPDKGEQFDSSKEKYAIDLFDRTTNKGKNDLLAEYLDEISKMIEWHVSCTSRVEFKALQLKYGMYLEKAFDNTFPYLDYHRNIQRTKTFFEDIFENDSDTAYPKCEANAYIIRLKGIENTLKGLSEVIRIYGKIEWTRAKKGA